jgi:hypothetical protein
MASETREYEVRQAAHVHGRLFAVRLWKEALDGGSEYGGSVRDLVTDAFRSFRDWSDLVAFMVARLEHEETARGARAKGGT